MTTLALVQAVAVPTMPGWVGPTVAISLVIIALSFLTIAAVMAFAAMKAASQARRVADLMSGVQGQLTQTVGNVRRMVEQTQELLVLVRHEAGAYAQTGRRVRRKLNKGVDRVEEKLHDLEALYDIVHGEVEDTALDVAATLKQVRAPEGPLTRVRSLLGDAR